MHKKAFGTYEIAEICNVTPSTIGNWIDKGLLPTFTTGGGHRRVWAEDLIDYLQKHNVPIPDKLKEFLRFDILIVDDEDNIRKIIKKILLKIYPDAVMHEASDGFEAGQKITNLTPKLVILDIKLPGMNGLKVCEVIRADKRLINTKILAISGYNIDTNKKESLEAGADDFIGKPFNTSDFSAKVVKLMGKK
jgi:excisionase family DNA binding protein